jgi:hypothetical protein
MRSPPHALYTVLVSALGSPIGHLLDTLAAGLGWAGAVLAICVLIRTLMLPVGYLRTRSARVLAGITERGVHLHQELHADKQAYHDAFRRLYRKNRVSPGSIFGWYVLQMAVFILFGAAVASRYARMDREGAQLLGAPLTSYGAQSWTGVALAITLTLLCLALVWRGRAAYKGAGRLLQTGGALVVVAFTGLLGLLLPLPIVLFVLTTLVFSTIEWPVTAWWAKRMGKSWPIYDENGQVIGHALGSEPAELSAL